MPYTVPNQRTVFIHRNMLLNDFLGIQNANWQAAARDLGAHALMLYLYLASNANNYEFALSPAAIRQAIDGLDFTADAYGTPQTVNNEAGKDIEININKTDTINISGVEKQVSPTPIPFNF